MCFLSACLISGTAIGKLEEQLEKELSLRGIAIVAIQILRDAGAACTSFSKNESVENAKNPITRLSTGTFYDNRI